MVRGPAGSPTVRDPPTTWSLERGERLRWKTRIPGLGHGSPIVWGDHVFVVTAVSGAEDPPLTVGLFGSPAPADDDETQQWRLYALDARSGEVLWNRVAHEGAPATRRHAKASHANATPTTDGTRVVASFGSAGLHAYDFEGNRLWSRDLGVLDAGSYNIPAFQWGYASSPLLHDGKVLVLADVQGDSFLASLDADTGADVWRVGRDDVPTWGTPTVVEAPLGAAEGQRHIVVNGFRHIGAYDFATGAEVWRLSGGGDVPVPTPIAGHGLVFVTNAHGRLSPVYAIRQGARGDISLEEDATTSAGVAWSVLRGSGAYMQTPVLLGDELYVCRDNGTLTVFDARTGQEHYKERLTSSGDGFTASAVAAGGRLYLTSEVGDVHVIAAGPSFERLATNSLDEVVMATPAIAHDTIYFRTKGHVVAIGEPSAAPEPDPGDPEAER